MSRSCFAVACFLLLIASALSLSSARAADIELKFAYGSEKKDWIKEVTDAFNNQGWLEDGQKIHVKYIPMGSGELAEGLKSGQLQIDIASPASDVFLNLVGRSVLIEPRSLVESPVVIAIWEDRARALGWPAARLGWKDILTMAKEQVGWARVGHPEWGSFKFGHTHPKLSNSGLIAVVAQVYASRDKSAGLTRLDAESPESGEFLRAIGRLVVTYGPSTGFFGDTMAANPDRLDAAVLYENMVAAYNEKSTGRKLVAIYPTEGTFMSNHPIGIVNAAWVTDLNKRAAKKYIDYLFAAPQQARALFPHGFRPIGLPVGKPIDAAHFVNPTRPSQLEVPTPDVIQACQDAWVIAKKPANIVLVLGATVGHDGHVREVAKSVISRLGKKDKIMILNAGDPELAFIQPSPQGNTGADKATLIGVLGSRFQAAQEVRLIEAVNKAHTHLSAKIDSHEIGTVIVLCDNLDNGSELNVDAIAGQIRFDRGENPVLVVTAECEKPAARVVGPSGKTIMEEITAAAGGKFFQFDKNTGDREDTKRESLVSELSGYLSGGTTR